MINIFCTKKLEKLLGPVSRNEEIKETEHNWTGNLLMVNRKKCLLFIDKNSLYIFLILGFSIKNLSKIKKMFLEEFINQLKRDKIYSIESEYYFNDLFSEINFFRTDNDQKTLGTVRDAEMMMKHFLKDDLDKNVAILKYQVNYMNSIPLGGRKYANAKKLIVDDLKSKGIIA
jgi:hypothetical protein